MEQTYIALLRNDHKSRTYFFRDIDEALAFDRLFEGTFATTTGGYTVTI